MFLIREDWKDAIGSVDRKGLLTPMKRVFDDWNSNKPIVCFYMPDEYYKNNPSKEEPIYVDNICRGIMTNNKPYVIGITIFARGARFGVRQYDCAYMFVKDKGPIYEVSRFHSLFDDSDSVILLKEYLDGLYYTTKDYSTVNPIMMTNCHYCEYKAIHFTNRNNQQHTNIYTAHIENIGTEKRKGNFIILYGDNIFLFNIDEKKMKEVEDFVDSIQQNVLTDLAANRTREDVAYFTIRVGNNVRTLEIEHMTDAFTCI